LGEVIICAIFLSLSCTPAAKGRGKSLLILASQVAHYIPPSAALEQKLFSFCKAIHVLRPAATGRSLKTALQVVRFAGLISGLASVRIPVLFAAFALLPLNLIPIGSFASADRLALGPRPDVPPEELLETVVDRELAADKNDESRWMYTSEMHKGRSDVVQEVVQTKQGTLYKHLSVDGRTLTEQEDQQQEERIRKVVANPADPQKLQREQTQDGNKAQQMLALLPKATIATYGEHRGKLVALNFKPNPDFHPRSHEAQVFGAMTGTIWVDPQENRLAEIDGHLLREVKFGGGILGHLDKGGTFKVVQSEVQPEHWEIVQLDVNMHGKALFFKSIAVQQHETRSNYKRMPDNLTLAQGAKLLDESQGRGAYGAH
jgi:hypothetical protein